MPGGMPGQKRQSRAQMGPQSLGRRAGGCNGRVFFFFFAGKYMTHFHFLQNSSGCVILTAHGLNMATSKL